MTDQTDPSDPRLAPARAPRLRLPRPGLAVRGHGRCPARALARGGRPSWSAPTPRSASRYQPPDRRGPGRGARPDGQRPAGDPGHQRRLPGGDARRGRGGRHRAAARSCWPATRRASTPLRSPPTRSTSRRAMQPRPRARPDHAGARHRRAAWAPSSASPTSRCTRSWTQAREHGEIGVANAQRPGPDRPLRRHPGPRLRARDEQDGRRPQGGAPDGQRGQPLPADAPRPRRVQPDPGQGPVPRADACRCSATCTPASSRPPTACAGSSPSTSSTACNGPTPSAAWRPTA